MKLRSVALVGVVCLAALGLIGAGARAVFTTSTRSGQTITVGSFKSTTAPSVAVTYPVNDTTYGADWTGTITGTASSNSGAGTTIKDTLVAIEDTTTSTWWDGTSFGASAESFTATSGTPANWTLALAASNLTSGDNYSVIAQATDSLGNIGTSSTVTFTYDTAAPTVVVTYPANGTQYDLTTWGNQITGTAASNSGAGTTIAATAVAIEDTNTHSWWSTSGFSAASQTFVPVSGTSTWSLVFAAANLTSGDNYSVIAQATDSAGNVGTSTPVAFTYCNRTTKVPPTVTITYPVNDATYGATTWQGDIAGSASSNSGPGTSIASVAVAIEDTATKQWWNGSSFGSGSQSFIAATGKTTWLLGFPALNLTSGVTYDVIAQATDSAGNVGTSSPVSFTYCVRTAPPSVAITNPVNNATYGANWLGEITGTASPNSGVGTTITGVAVAIQNLNTGKWWTSTGFNSSSQTFNPASGGTTWNLPFAVSNLTSGDNYNVVAQATDSLKNLGTSTPVRFTYCNRTSKAPPTVAITYPVNNTSYGTNWGGSITGTAVAGTGSTIAKVKVSLQQGSGLCWAGAGDTYTAVCPNYVAVTNGTTTWSLLVPNSDLSSNDGYKVTAEAIDSYGNVGTSSPVSFSYATPPPTVTIAYPVNKTAYGTNWTGSITGTASTNSGPTTNITGVSVAVENTTTSKWLAGTSFSGGSQSFQTASGTTSWSFAVSAKYLVSGDAYSVIAKATDSVGNTGTSALVSFTFNSSPPSVAITYPMNNAKYGSTNWGGTITGTASSDSGTGATITGVSVAVENTSTKRWWNGSSFSATSQTFVAVTGSTTNWSLALATKSLVSCDNYTVIAEATDSLGNVGTSPAVTFIYNNPSKAHAVGGSHD